MMPKKNGYTSIGSISKSSTLKSGVDRGKATIKDRLRNHCEANKASDHDEHYLYVMQSMDMRGFIKVGISKNVGLRSAKPTFKLGMHSSGLVSQSELQSVWKPIVRNNLRFSNRTLAKTLETLIHHQLSEYRLDGEYFYIGKQGMATLDKLLADIVTFAKDSLGETVSNGDEFSDQLEDF